MRWLSPSLKPLLNLFLESCCPLCQRSTGHFFCRDCLRQVKGCRQPDPLELWNPPLPLFAWGVYTGALKRAIAALKYNNHPQLARPLGHWLAQTWLASPIATSAVVVVPIPMHPDKQKQRGFNQAELLAEAFCETARLPLQRRGLKRVRTTVAQFGLAVADREQNLAGAFELDRPFEHRYPNRSVLLIDDIYTTGATARSAAQTFQDHQIKVYGLAAIAKPALGFKKDAQSGESGEG